MPTIPTRTIAFVSLAALGACSAVDCSTVSTDPTQGGLLGGHCGLSQGTYARNAAQQSATLAIVQQETAAQAALRQDLDRRYSTIAAASTRTGSELDALNAQNAWLREQVAAAQAGAALPSRDTAALNARIAGVEAERRALESTLRSGGTDMARYRAQMAELQRRIDAIATMP